MQHRHGITWDDIEKMEVDANGRLYWAGQAVLLEQHLRLNWVERIIAAIAALGAVAAGIHPFGVSFGWW